jgi:hypothetical protein
MTDIIWENTLDGRYLCRVVRVSARTGRLTVRDVVEQRVLLEIMVSLRHGAEYGPDVENVDEWGHLAETAVANAPSKPSISCPKCAVRPGLGTCNDCSFRMARGVDGMEKWSFAVIRFLDAFPNDSLTTEMWYQRTRLLDWARGEDIHFEGRDDTDREGPKATEDS